MWTLYSFENCGQCQTLKEYLNKNNIPFEEKILDRDFNAGDLIAETSKRGNPTMSFPVLINDTRCFTLRQLFKNSMLDEVWLEENL